MIWYPYEQMKTMKPPYKIVDAEGVYIYTEEKKLIDSVSSWWSVIHGYKNPEITNAIKEQADKFSHVMLGGLTHDPVLKLSQKLKEWLPGDLDYCFFSDSGSVAVEVALKMALQYYVNKGDMKKTKIMGLTHAYHGDTFKTMEAGDDEDYHFILEAYGENKNVIHIPTEISALEEAFLKYHEELNCFIVEPLLQGAGGMRMYDISFLQRARELCDKYDVLLIFDEVATGFGRTGYRFVSDVVLPDIIVLGKALTGGHIGHAVTVAGHKVYDGFYSDNASHALMHGPTFMGNALACSAALASIELFEKGDYIAKIKHIEEVTKRELNGFSSPLIKEIRIMGGCSCIEVYDPSVLRGFQAFAYERGVFARPFLSYMYTMVPYIIGDEDLVKIFDTMKAWIRKMEKKDMIKLAKEIIAGRRINRNDDLSMFLNCDLEELGKGADMIREHFVGDKVDLCSIINGRSGRCPEDCKYCAQSAYNHTECEIYDFLPAEKIIEACKFNEENGVDRFSIVTAGRALSGEEFDKAIDAYKAMSSECKIDLCASMGFLTKDQLHRLHEAGVTSYHHNIETSKRNFPNICTTHTYDMKIETLKMVKEEGMYACSGGIVGMGETWEDRLDMAISLAEASVDSIPINALMPIKGTPLENLERISEDDLLRIVAFFRYINPKAAIRLAAGRALLTNDGEKAFRFGASATITGNMLTTVASATIASDKAMLKKLGRDVIPEYQK